MVRRYGRGPLGERLVDAVPQGHWRTTTFVAGLRQNGVIAPLVLDGAMTGAAFRAYVEQFLAPALAPGDVGRARQFGRPQGRRRPPDARRGRSLPPLPADFAPGSQHRPPRSVRSGAPIEQPFAKLKALLRKAARTQDELWSTIGRLLATVPPAQCARYLHHCEYAPI
jgi:transposase